MRKLAVLSLSLLAAFSTVMPAQAFPSLNGPTFQASDVQLIQYRRHFPAHTADITVAHGAVIGTTAAAITVAIGPMVATGTDAMAAMAADYYGGGYNDFGLLLGGLATGAIIGGALAQPRLL